MVGDPILRGRAASEQALLTAAADLICDVGPNAVSVRAIADRAGVNHGLVHHYYGSKSGLIKAVLDQLSSDSSAAIRERGMQAVLDPEDERVRRHARVLARVILDNAAPEGFQDSFPVVDHLAIMVNQNSGLDERTSRVRAVEGVGLILGWLLFEPFLLASAGLTGEDRALMGNDLRPALIRLALGEAPAGG